jgi:NitT/TauT family transport system substrate-binding protein
MSGSGVVLGQAGRRIRLAFCSQLLCVVPYEFTRARGLFAAEGLDVELVYTRGGSAAMQALVGGAVDYAATSFDVALLAFSNGAPIRRFATTGRLPLFALASAPGRSADLTSVTDLAGTTLGVSALGNADHVLALYLLEASGVDASGVSFATLGVNLFEALRRGQVDAGMVQEPALSLLLEEGGSVLFNAMDLDDAVRVLGGPYEFMGVAVRADELAVRHDEMRAVARALQAGLIALQTAPVEELVAALPSELIAGDDVERLHAILERTRRSLYPDTVVIDVDSSRRVEESQRIARIREEPVDLSILLATDVLGAPGF